MNKGYISLHRKLLEWEWYQDNNVKSVFLHCLIKANYSDKKWQGVKIKRGQFITSQLVLSAELKLSIGQIRRCLKKLESTNEILIKATNKNTLITVVKYDDYQIKDFESDTQTNNKRHSNDIQTTTTNNNNNKNNKNKIREYFKEFAKENNLKTDLVLAQFERAFEYYEDLNFCNSKGKEIKNLKTTIKNNWFKLEELSKFEKPKTRISL